jgi:predicted Zn-dependent protease
LKTLAPLRAAGATHPAFELLAGQLLGDMGATTRRSRCTARRCAPVPSYRATSYAYYDLLLQTGHTGEVIAELEQRLRSTQEDARLYELQARAFAASASASRSTARRPRRTSAAATSPPPVDQLELAVKTKSDNFYELSSAESRLRELRSQLEIEKAAEKALKIS